MTDLITAAKTSERALLEALRDTIAATIAQGVAARDLASLSRRLLEVNRELEGAIAKDDFVDDITEAAATPDEPFAP